MPRSLSVPFAHCAAQPSIITLIYDAIRSVPYRTVAVLALAVWLGQLAAPSRADVLSPGDFVLKYDPGNGNMKLVFTGTGAAGSGPISLLELNVLTLGDTLAGNPAMPAGIPNVTAGQGGLNGSRATLPTAGFQTFNTGSNSAGINGIYSQIYNGGVSSWITFTKTSPGVSDTLDLGNVAATGWSQANIDAIFMTDPELYGGERHYGNFGYTVDGFDLRIAPVQAVPEPGTTAMLVAGAVACGAATLRRRYARRRAAQAARPGVDVMDTAAVPLTAR